MLLGAILAGGRSTRFGRDKAMEALEGRTLIERTFDALAARTAEVVVCGREWGGLRSLPDRPSGVQGPLAGLYAALEHGLANRFDTVVCAPVDVHPIDEALELLLSRDGCAVLTGQFSVGHWPTSYAGRLAEHIAQGGRSLYGWIEIARPRRVDDRQFALTNINTKAELDEVRSRSGEP